jgi:hypothetical protein
MNSLVVGFIFNHFLISDLSLKSLYSSRWIFQLKKNISFASFLHWHYEAFVILYLMPHLIDHLNDNLFNVALTCWRLENEN